jgi:SAM-dependent methyltransferase
MDSILERQAHVNGGPQSSPVLDGIGRLAEALRPQAAPGVWEAIAKALPPRGEALNAGAGRGGMSLLLSEAGYGVTSIDLYPEHFAAGGLSCQRADLHKPLEFLDAAFDLVLAVEVMEHLENPWQFLRESIRVLRPGGVMLFTTPNVVSIASRMLFLASGLLPYFREESFLGCYHVTPIYPWAVERCCRTTSAIVESVSYSRIDWPRNDDVPRYDGGGGLRRAMLDRLPLNRYTGEIACFRIRKTASAPRVLASLHPG